MPSVATSRLVAEGCRGVAGRGRRLWAGLLILAACHRPLVERDPGALIAVRTRALEGVGVERVAMAVDGRAALPLQPADRPGEFDGSVALAPGAHRLSFQGLGSKGAQLASATFALQLAPGAAALLDVALQPSESVGPDIQMLSAGQASLAVGESVRLEVQLAPAPSASRRLAWSTRPAGCGRFTSEGAAATSLTALAPGMCRAVLTVTTQGRPDRRSLALLVRGVGHRASFPLRIAPGSRHLEDAQGVPFLIKGEAAWLALVNLTEAEQEAYLADRAARGFNLVEVMLINHDYSGPPSPVPPANRRGEQPFLQPGDFSTPNDLYFDRAVAFVDRAAAHGVAVLLAPNYLGFDGGREGWWGPLNAPANAGTVCHRFGRYLGERFRDRHNVLWLAGGDFAPPVGSEGERRHWAILQGIRAAGAMQLWTGHWNLDHLGGISTDQPLFAQAIQLNGIYQYAEVFRFALRAFAVQPPRPVFLLESTYEHEHPSSNLQPFRKAWWWSMLSGASGVLWSNLFLWMAESARGTYRAEYGDADHALSSWAAELDSPGTRQMLRLHAFFEGLPWHRLLPGGTAGRPELVTSGQQGGRGHIAAAATPEGDLVVAYVPPTGKPGRRFRLDLSGLHGPAVGRFYDPVAGAFVHAVRVPTPSRGVEFETPGANAAGLDDWALVVQPVPDDPG